MLNQGSREVASSSNHSRPGSPAFSSDGDDVLDLAGLGEVRVHAELHRAPRQAAHFFIGTEDLRIHSGHHARHGLVADLRERLLAEGEERHVRAVAQQQELEVVMPHPEVSLERLLVGLEQIVVGGDAAAGVHMFERLEFRQRDLGQLLRIADQRQHLVAPLRRRALPSARSSRTRAA